MKQVLAPLGVNVAAMTYDAVARNARFQARTRITYPLLSDTGFRHAMSFGILNEDYGPGHRFYGIAHPGIILVSPSGEVIAKFAEADFRERPDYEQVLDSVRSWLQSAAGRTAAAR